MNAQYEGRSATNRPTMRAVLLFALRVFASSLFLASAFAEDKKPDEKKPGPPKVVVVLPLGIEAGTTNQLTVRGLDLTNATRVRFIGPAETIEARITAREPGGKLDGFDAAKVGDQKLVVEFVAPSEAAPDLQVVVTSALGDSAPHPVVVAPAGRLVDEKEPDNGFRDAQEVRPGQTVRGLIADPNDVDVFAVQVEAGRTLRAEVRAERLGGTLDGSLTLYSDKGQILATNDDSVGRDPAVQFCVTATGRYLIALSSVTEKAAATHAYLLDVTVSP